MVPSASDAWRTALRDLRETLPERTVQNWLEPITPLALDTDEGAPTLTLQVPTPFGIQYLRSRFQRSIRQAVTDAVGEPTDVAYQVTPEEERPNEIAADSDPSPSPDGSATTAEDRSSASPPASSSRNSSSRNSSSRNSSSRNASSDGTGAPDGRSSVHPPGDAEASASSAPDDSGSASTERRASPPQTDAPAGRTASSQNRGHASSSAASEGSPEAPEETRRSDPAPPSQRNGAGSPDERSALY